jgi:hypothetical protein
MPVLFIFNNMGYLVLGGSVVTTARCDLGDDLQFGG